MTDFDAGTRDTASAVLGAHRARERALDEYGTDDPGQLREMSQRVWETLQDEAEAAWLLRLAETLESAD